MRRAASCAAVTLSGAVLTLAFPEPDLAPLAWVALVPLFATIAACPFRRPLAGGFLLGFCFGVGFFATLLYWISLIGIVPWAVLVLLQSCFIGAFGASWAACRPATAPAWVWMAALPASWVTFEFVRALVPLNGFTWGQLAQSQHDLGWMLKPAAVGGGWAVAAIVVAINAALCLAWKNRSVGSRALGWLASAAVLASAPLIVPSLHESGGEVTVAIVQGNVPREIPRGLDREIAIIESHVRLTEQLSDRNVDVVVWPESSLGLDARNNPIAADALRRAATAVDAPLIVGANLDVDEDRYLVVALHVSETGEVIERYQKTHLVPFGEYVPARSALDWIPMLDQVPRDAVAGRSPAVFDIAGGAIAPVISFEGDFGSLVRKPIAAGGRLLVVATNTSTWGETWASAQHVAFSQVRAVENGVWVAHAALSGISAVIDPTGKVVASTRLWEPATLVEEMTFAAGPTPYARYGDWLPLAGIIATIAFVIGARRRADTVAA